MPYEKYLRENLFLPAGMKDTGYKLPQLAASTRRRRLSRRQSAGARITEKPWAADGPYWALRANGGIHSTLDDMLRWHVALVGRRRSSPPPRRTRCTTATSRRGRRGFVLRLRLVDQRFGVGLTRSIEHNGGNGTFFADFLRYVDDDLVVILSTNDSEVKGGRISHALARSRTATTSRCRSRAR